MSHSSHHRPSGLWEKVAETWCRAMHPAPMWPVNGQYRCPTCLRTYPVPWEAQQHPPARAVPAAAPVPVAVTTRASSLGRAA